MFLETGAIKKLESLFTGLSWRWGERYGYNPPRSHLQTVPVTCGSGAFLQLLISKLHSGYFAHGKYPRLIIRIAGRGGGCCGGSRITGNFKQSGLIGRTAVSSKLVFLLLWWKCCILAWIFSSWVNTVRYFSLAKSLWSWLNCKSWRHRIFWPLCFK